MTKKKQIERKKLPVYEIVIDPNDETSGVKMVSLLSDPAIEVRGQAFKRPTGLVTPPCHFADAAQTIENCECDIVYNPLIGDHEWITGDSPCEFCLANKDKWDALNLKFKAEQFKAIEEQKLIIAPVLIPNKKIFRRDPETGDEYYVVFTPEVITQIMEKFNKGNNNRSINLDNTNTMAPAFLRENWLVADSVYDKSKVYGYDLPKGTWVWLLKVEDDEFWKTQIKELGKYSLSIEGILGQKLMQFALNTDKTDDFSLELLSNKQLIELADYALRLLRK